MTAPSKSKKTATAFVLEMRVVGWEAWAPGLPDQAAWRRWASVGEEAALPSGLDPSGPRTAAPAAATVPALLRRRAGLSDRLGLEVAGRLARSEGKTPCVFASRHGQIARSVAMLEDLAVGTPLSPMDFSVSVHNATVGLFSIAYGDRSAASAVAAGPESFSSGLMEAQGHIVEGADHALAVYHDERPPTVMDGLWDGEPAGWALALLLGRKEGQALEMTLEDIAEEAPKGHAWPQALVLARLLGRGEGGDQWRKGKRLWRWELRP